MYNMITPDKIIDSLNTAKGLLYFALFLVLTILVTVFAFRSDTTLGWISVVAFAMKWLTKIKFNKRSDTVIKS